MNSHVSSIGMWNDRLLCHYHENKRQKYCVENQRYGTHQPTAAVQPSFHTFGVPSARPCPRKILEMEGYRFSTNNKLGKGRYSKVVRALDVCARRKVAIKVIDLSTVTEEFRENFLPREIECWKRMKNLNNCFLYREFVRNDFQFAVMELAEFGDMLSFVQKNGAVQEPLGRNWMIQLINGLKYLHSRKIAHRDLKMENVLLFRDNVVKICDYGFCKPGIDLSETFCGSKSYSSPEILSGRTYDMYKSDVWSLGVIGFVMISNTMPFREDVEHNDIIVEAQKFRRYRYPSNLRLSHSCRATLDSMMTFDPHQRPDIKQCCSLPWFQPQPLPDASHYYPSPQSCLYHR